jgi:hypothetical protein
MKMNEYLDRALKGQKAVSEEDNKNVDIMTNLLKNMTPEQKKSFLAKTGLKETTVMEAEEEVKSLTSQDEKMIASKMKAKGYKFVLVFPKEYNLEPLYVKDMAMGRGLMRDEFKRMKGMTITSVSKWLGEKDTEE